MDLYFVPKNKKKKFVKSNTEGKTPNRRIWLLTDDESILDSFLKDQSKSIDHLFGYDKFEFTRRFQSYYDQWRYEKHGLNWKKDSYSLLPF